MLLKLLNPTCRRWVLLIFRFNDLNSCLDWFCMSSMLIRRVGFICLRHCQLPFCTLGFPTGVLFTVGIAAVLGTNGRRDHTCGSLCPLLCQWSLDLYFTLVALI